MPQHEEELQQVGLSEREAAVYDAALALGESPALVISRKASIPRATTYLALKELQKKELITSREEKNTTVFTAVSPQQLDTIVNKRLHQLENTRDMLADLIPQLQASWNDSNDTTRLYSGVDEVNAVHGELVRQAQPDDLWYRLIPVDQLREAFGNDDFLREKQQKARGVKSRVLFTTSSPDMRERLLKTQTRRIQRKALDNTIYSSNASVTVCRGRVLIEVFRDHENVNGIDIDSDVVATLMSEMLRMIWARF